jgi:hypothetical protein
MLNRLNTHGVALAGLAIGGGSIVASVGALFKLLSDPTYIDALFVAIMHAREHKFDSNDLMTYAKLAAAFFAIVGAIVIALLLTYFGRPASVPADANTTGAVQASTTHPEDK